MSRDSGIQLVSVVTAPSGTILGIAAKNLATGNWTEITVANLVQALGFGFNPIGTDGQVYGFTSTMPWSSIAGAGLGRIEYVMGDHVGSTPALQYLQYQEAGNTFAQILPPGGAGIPSIGHGYNANDVNPANGDIYHQMYANTGHYRKRTIDASFSQLVANDGIGGPNSGESAFWWIGGFTGAGAHGCWVTYRTGAIPGAVGAYDPLTSTWFYANQSATPSWGDNFQTIGAYSASKNVAVFGGGHSGGTSPAQTRKMWKMTSNRTVTSIDPPFDVGVKTGHVAADPVTGNFIFLSGLTLWEFNPTNNQYTQLTGTRAVPAGMADMSTNGNAGVLLTAIPDYGVIAFVSMAGSNGPGHFYLYKHAAGFATNFTAASNPLDPTKWLGGQSVGLDWRDFQAVSAPTIGHACAAAFSSDNPPPYNDAIAILKSSVFSAAPDQFAEMTVFRDVNYNPAGTHELGLFVRFSLSAHTAIGYEAYRGAGGAFTVVRWAMTAGTPNLFFPLFSGTPGVPQDGDVVRFEVQGSTLRYYVNGTLIASGTDGNVTSGQPGMQSYVVSTSMLNRYGAKSFRCGNL